jgi:hypothetical protein
LPTATRTFRVFVSSTFEDLKAERDSLQREVFPRLRKLGEEKNARFQAIDLRWGVRDEAALDQQTMEICLREIERCQETGIKPKPRRERAKSDCDILESASFQEPSRISTSRPNQPGTTILKTQSDRQRGYMMQFCISRNGNLSRRFIWFG